MESYEEIEFGVRYALYKLVKGAKGTMITFTPKRIAVLGGLSTKPVVLSIVRHILEMYREKGWISLYKKTRHGYRYQITRDSPLWERLKKK